MKQSLQLKISQNLALTPQLQQSIRLLQLSTLELNQELEMILQDNPLLELVEGDDELSGDEHSGDESTNQLSKETNNDHPIDEHEANGDDHHANEETHDAGAQEPLTEAPLSENDFKQSDFDEDYEEYGSASPWDEGSRQHSDEDDDDFTRQETVVTSLRNHLLDQIKLLTLSDRDQRIMLLLIDSINENGYLESSLEDIMNSLPDELEIEFVELETALKHIQNLDPIGIGATNLQECILLQLNTLPHNVPDLALAKMIVKDHLHVLANKDFNKLRKLVSCNEESLRRAQALIQLQNPRPGASFAQFSPDHFIQHEVIVKKIKGIWVATLNDGVMPKLRINQMYADILKRNRENSGQYLQSQMQEARWMIKNIQQRFSTILRVSQAIIDRQRNFFEHGEIAMRPLVLREIAEELELHESTISRVTTHKYMLTPRGVFELKYFFGSHVSTDSGGECSATAIRALIKQLVAEENSKKPLSDNQISEILSKQGIVVARRTIAKYREALNIPPANLRKSL
ncbi:MAG: RNA polymerase factor sigma-54 [Methylophilaceae bacterium]|nr:MAG: RNA polymerase factor sigma-54 [Methylophilaceae bacterium]